MNKKDEERERKRDTVMDHYEFSTELTKHYPKPSLLGQLIEDPLNDPSPYKVPTVKTSEPPSKPPSRKNKHGNLHVCLCGLVIKCVCVRTCACVCVCVCE